MTETRLGDRRGEAPKSQGDSLGDAPKNYWPKAPHEATGELLSLAEIQRRHSVDEYRIYRWVEEGRLHVVQDGKRFKYPDWEVREILRELFGRLRTAA